MRKIVFLAIVGIGLFGVGAAGETLVPNRLAVAAIGEWVSFELPDGYVQKHTVVKREGEGPGALVTIRVDNIYDDEIVDSNYITETAGEPLAELPHPEREDITLSSAPETFGLKGKQYPGTAITVKRDGKTIQVWYVSSDLPVYGLGKRVDAEGADDFEIADFGMK